MMFSELPLWKEKSIYDMSRLNDYKVVWYHKTNLILRDMVEFYNYMIESSGVNPMAITSRIKIWKD